MTLHVNDHLMYDAKSLNLHIIRPHRLREMRAIANDDAGYVFTRLRCAKTAKRNNVLLKAVTLGEGIHGKVYSR